MLDNELRELCSFPFANVANVILSSNNCRQAMNVWESGCAGSDGDLGWAVKERAEEMLMLLQPGGLGISSTQTHGTKSHRRMNRLCVRRSREEHLGTQVPFQAFSAFNSTTLPVPDPPLSHLHRCQRPQISWPSPHPFLQCNIYCLPCTRQTVVNKTSKTLSQWRLHSRGKTQTCTACQRVVSHREKGRGQCW